MFSIKEKESFNELDKLIYDYVIKNKEAILKMRLKDLANNVHVSPSTVLRFCKKLGFNGFSEFKANFKLYLNQEVKTVQDNLVNQIYHFLNYVDNSDFKDKLDFLANKISQSETVIFFGIGNSGILAKYAAKYLSNCGKLCFFIDDSYYDLSNMKIDNTILIVLSESGKTIETITLANEFKNKGIYVASITNNNDNTLAHLSDYNLNYYVDEEKLNEYINITSQIPMLFIIETLGHELVSFNIKEK